MREFKFRAWHKTHNKWVKKDGSFVNVFELHLPQYEMLIFQQYTGLKDKNGNEIYEGDILTYTISNSIFTGVVEWQNNGWVIQEFDYDSAYPMCGAYNPLIVGNIYENPELIKTEI